MGDFDPTKLAIKRPIWELHKKGEVMPSSDFWGKYSSFSMTPIKDSYQTAVMGRIKAHYKMEAIRKREVSAPPVPRMRDPDVWSDTSDNASVFKGDLGVSILARGKRDTSKRDPEYMAPDVKSVYDRIEALILEPKVQTACNHIPMKGSKYDYWGGQPQTSEQFKRYSKEDPWEYPKP